MVWSLTERLSEELMASCYHFPSCEERGMGDTDCLNSIKILFKKKWSSVIDKLIYNSLSIMCCIIYNHLYCNQIIFSIGGVLSRNCA